MTIIFIFFQTCFADCDWSKLIKLTTYVLIDIRIFIWTEGALVFVHTEYTRLACLLHRFKACRVLWFCYTINLDTVTL